jgi:hypothetical protein
MSSKRATWALFEGEPDVILHSNSETLHLMGDFQLSGRPSRVRQREIQQIVRGAMKAGASGVTVRVGEASVVIALNASDLPHGTPVEANEWDGAADVEDKA